MESESPALKGSIQVIQFSNENQGKNKKTYDFRLR